MRPPGSHGLLAILLLLLLLLGPAGADEAPLGGPPSFWRPGHAELYRWSTADGEQVLESMDPATGRWATLVRLGRLRRSVQRRPLALRRIGRRAPPPFVWEPEGRGLVVVSNGDLVWKDLEGSGARRRLTQTTTPLADVRVAPGGRHVSFARDHDLWVVATKAGEPRRLTTGGDERLRNATLDWVYPEEFDVRTACWWAPDGSRIAYLQMDERAVRRYRVPGTSRVMRYPRAGEANPRVRIGVVAVGGGETTWLDLGEEPPAYVPRVAWSPDGAQVLATVFDRSQQTMRLLACPADGGEPVVLIEEHDGRWVDCPPAPRFVDERRFLWRSAAGGHHGWYLATLPASGRGKAALERLTRATEDVVVETPPAFDAETGRLHYAVETDDGLRQRPRVGTEGAEPPYAPPPGMDVTVRIDPTGTFALVSSSRTFEPKRVALHRVRDGALVRVLAAPPAPAPASLPRVEIGRVDDEAGRLVWRLWSPRDLDVSKAHPLVHLVYGGPGFRRIRDRWEPGRVREVGRYLDRGWLVLEIDGLGSRGFGAERIKKVHGRLGLGEIDDQVRAVRIVAARPTVDASRVGIMGWSFGGTMTCLGLMRHPDVYRAGVAIAPVTDWRLYDTIYTERYLGLPADHEAAYRDTAVVELVGALRAPLLVLHGEADDNVHVENARRLEAAARAQGKASLEVRVFPGVGHGLGRRQREARQQAHAFLERHLQGALLPPGRADPSPRQERPPADEGLLPTERLAGSGVWIDPLLQEGVAGGKRLRATVWFEDQFLGDGQAYDRRAREFRHAKRTELGKAVVRTLKALSDASWAKAEDAVGVLLASEGVRNVDRFWIVNGFACGVTAEGLARLAQVPGVRKIFLDTSWRALPEAREGEAPRYEPMEPRDFDPERYRHPWYVRYLLADKVWKEFGVTGKGTLSVVHDHNFVFSDNVTQGLHRNPGEIPGNLRDDDGNGLVDDYHGFNFNRGNDVLTTVPVPPAGGSGANLHGFLCSAIICGRGAEGAEYEFGVAPEGTWAGVISARRMEAAVQWAVEQGADTYSMSFSVPEKGEHRSHWRKVMEHGAFCGVCFVSGAGNFALQQEVPVQMRQPEDIPNAVFAAAGVHRDLSRTSTSSQGPVVWDTEHYRDGTIQKPAVCAFNFGLPVLFRDGSVRERGLSGNSFAGPMFCGAIALMISADPDLLPWDLREIITSTAMDIGERGVDPQTGYGLINCYRAVKEVLRRKAKREGKPTGIFEGRVPGDELAVRSLSERLRIEAVIVDRLWPKGQAKALGVHVGDVLQAYDGKPIPSRARLREHIQAAQQAGTEKILLELRRGEETVEVTLAPGPIGIRAADRYDEPVFE